MDWREAFLIQAQSDFQMMDQLAKANARPCHRLHYLQMATEKLARGWRTIAGHPAPPPKTHIAFVRLLQQLKSTPWVRRQLGYPDESVFRSFINSLLDTARRVQALVPAEAGYDQPNPEYPWLDRATGVIQAPSEYDFEEFDARNVKLRQLSGLVRSLLLIARR